MGLSSAAFAAETATPAKTAAPAKTTQTTQHHKNSIKKPLSKKRRRLKSTRKKMAKKPQPNLRQKQLRNQLRKS
ncbi:acid resistance repetitive basic protein Asr [Salmonella enterica]